LSTHVRNLNTDSANPRICLLTDSYYPVVGGGEAHARLLCAELRRLGVPVFVVTGHKVPGSPSFEAVDGVPVYRVPPAGFKRLGKYLMLGSSFWRLLRMRREYDVIYVCGIRTLGLIAVVAARLLGKGCVLRSESRGELSGGFIWEKADGRINRLLKSLFILPVAIRNLVLRRADAFLSIAGVIRDEYRACRVPAEKIADIPNGIDVQRFCPIDPELKPRLRLKLNLPEQGRLFAYTGKLNRGTGLEFLVRVWKDWGARHPDCRLLLIGSGAMQFLSCEAELREYVTRNSLDESVIFAGSVSNVEDYLRAADFFVFPSESEAMPLALMEALATGLPAVASDIPGCRAVITDGREGRLAPPNDSAAWVVGLDTLVGDPARVAAWGRSGRETVVATFCIARIAEAHLKLFKTVTGKGGRYG
jgi:glycosyltransferase involved in cell wall biosynthesis